MYQISDNADIDSAAIGDCQILVYVFFCIYTI